MARLISPLVNKIAGDTLVSAQAIEIGVMRPQVNSLDGIYLTDAPFTFSLSTNTKFDGGLNTYFSTADLIGISDTKETGDIQISNVTLTFSLLNTTYRDALCVTGVINRTVNIYRVFFNESDYSTVGEPLLLFRGFVSGYKLNDAKETATFIIEASSQFVNFQRTNGVVTNSGSLQRYDRNTNAFEFAHKTDEQIFWGRKA